MSGPDGEAGQASNPPAGGDHHPPGVQSRWSPGEEALGFRGFPIPIPHAHRREDH